MIIKDNKNKNPAWNPKVKQNGQNKTRSRLELTREGISDCPIRLDHSHEWKGGNVKITIFHTYLEAFCPSVVSDHTFLI